MTKPTFILASASPRRLQLLQQIGLAPDKIVPADIDETPAKDELPMVYAKRMAGEKARAVSALHPDSVVLAADTVVACGRRILPRADDEKTAKRCLEILSGRRHRVYTAVCIIAGEKTASACVMTQVKFSRLEKTDIAAYLASNEWQGKAGGYAIQGRAAALIPFISGSYSNIVGLPLYETLQMLESLA